MVIQYKNIFIILLFFTILTIIQGQDSQPESPDIFLDVEFHSGFIPISETSDMFYWFFPSPTVRSLDPLVFWVAGEAGCSSTIDIFHGNGPFYINDDLSLRRNIYSWSTNSNFVYVDQPIGTGFSEANQNQLEKKERQIGDDFKIFLTQFLAKFTEFEGRKIFITGDSYAGHYIPAIGVELYLKGFNIEGILIGNGWVDPIKQYPAYARYAYANYFIDRSKYQKYQDSYQLCINLIGQNKLMEASFVCQATTNSLMHHKNGTMRFNQYDIRKQCDFGPPMCYNFTDVQSFYERPEVQNRLNTRLRNWKLCSDSVRSKLFKDSYSSLSHDVEFLLDKKIKVLVYNGDKDFICNWMGGEAWTNGLQWEGQQDFINQDYSDWIIGDEVKGQQKKILNLQFLIIFNSGHMVHMDQPETSLKILNELIHDWLQN